MCAHYGLDQGILPLLELLGLDPLTVAISLP